MHIFYTPDVNGAYYQLSETESKHCIRVLRLCNGDEVVLVDGKGGLYEARIIEDRLKHCKVEIIKEKRNFGKRDFQVHIAIAPTKSNDRTEWFLEKTTEIGVDRVVPILCRNSERKQIKQDRLEKVMIAAMKQSLKAFLPGLDPLTRFEDFVKQPFDGQKFMAHCEDVQKPGLKDIIEPAGNYLILIGPEGDFSTEEIEMAVQSGFIPVSLGESRLRTETAGVVACHTFHLVNG